MIAMQTGKQNGQNGFTLIELLVTIAIIGILSSIVMAGISTARTKSQDAERRTELKILQNILEVYYSTHDAYPVTSGWFGVSVNGGSKTLSGATAYIPNLTPTYIPELPKDPSGFTTGWSGYLYYSDGQSYKILNHVSGIANFPPATDPFYDPVRPTWAIMVCNGVVACSTW